MPASPSCAGRPAACSTTPGRTARPRTAPTRRKSARVFSVASLGGIVRSPGAAPAPQAEPTASGREALAALRAPRRQHPTPAGGGHARTETVTALADELAGLVSALHGTCSYDDC